MIKPEKPATLLVKKGQIWRNKKTLNDYEVFSLATGCDNDHNGQTVVIYSGGGELCTRYYTEFVQKFMLVE